MQNNPAKSETIGMFVKILGSFILNMHDHVWRVISKRLIIYDNRICISTEITNYPHINYCLEACKL